MRRKIVFMAALFAALAFTAFAQEEIKQSPSCKYCGMDRDKFGQSRMVLQYDDGTAVGTCSLHCAAVDLALTIDKTPAVMQVADMPSRNLVDAEKAFWVMGGNKPGVMTKRAKWAFANKADAEAFAKESGGTLVAFDEAIKAAYEDMYQDTKMIRERRKAKKKAAMEQHQH
jgi:nitrous oxide reductase accessory protein NosL